MDVVHIDPWKKYAAFEEGAQWTVDMINFCYDINPAVRYEVATEQGIRPLTVEELELLVLHLRAALRPEVYAKVQYLVIQCGTALSEKHNTGQFDADKLRAMLALCAKYGLTPKEHNGDWVSMETVRAKGALGLECVNIAPEFGEIETRVMLELIGGDTAKFDAFFNIVHASRKWEKWVTPGFDPAQHKEQTILIAGHYVLSYPDFLALKATLPAGADELVQKRVQARLAELHAA